MARDIGLRNMSEDLLRTLKRNGFGDRDIARLCGVNEGAVREKRDELGLRNAYKRIDTCAAEFESFTPYMYGTYERECEADPTPRPKVVILGSGPNRIGQGIEFDYCCCHAAFAARDEGFETVMINCNPETVSTDYDTVDRLYFEPLTFEDVLAVIDARTLQRRRGLVRGAVRRPDAAQAGAARCRRRASRSSAPRPIRSTWPRTASGSRSCCGTSGFRSRPTAWRRRRDEAREVAARIGFPVVVRPSYVLGGRAMAIVYDAGTLDHYMANAVDVSPEKPILIDRFLEDAFELDVDAVADGQGAVVIGGIMEHIEEAGIHSGDSSCVVPTYLVAEQAPRDDPGLHAADRARPQRDRPDERAVRDQGRRRSTCSRSTRAPRGRCRICRRPRACRSPRWRPADDRQDARRSRPGRMTST